MDKKATIKAILRNRLDFFIERTFQELHPDTTYQDNWHIQAIAYALERCHQGECTRLIITMPPRYLKSISVSVAFSAWILGRNPHSRIVAASYGQELASLHHNLTRKVMEAPWYHYAFPGTQIDKKKNTETDFRTTKHGGRFATSVGGRSHRYRWQLVHHR